MYKKTISLIGVIIIMIMMLSATANAEELKPKNSKINLLLFKTNNDAILNFDELPFDERLNPLRGTLELLNTEVEEIEPIDTFPEITNQDKIMKFLRNEVGLNTAAACTILGVMSVENSLFEPDLLQYGKTQRDLERGNDAGYGLIQWTNTKTYGAWRYNDLVNFCTENGYDYKTLEGQLWFLKHELEDIPYFVKLKVLDKLKETPNTAWGAYNATSSFTRLFMGSSNGIGLRASNARDIYWVTYSAYDETVA